MEAITGIIQTAMLLVGSLAVVVGAGFGLYVYYTKTGQEEGE